VQAIQCSPSCHGNKGFLLYFLFNFVFFIGELQVTGPTLDLVYRFPLLTDSQAIAQRDGAG
jgi:hypothetical protein